MVRTIPEPKGRGRRTGGSYPIPTPKSSVPKWQARLVVFLSIFVLVCAGLAFGLTRKEIQLTVDGRTADIVTHRQLVRTLLAAQNVRLGPADEVIPGLDTHLDRRMRIVIHRAAAVTVVVDGHRLSLLTPKQTVGEAVAAAGVVLGKRDRLEPSAKSLVTPGLVVIVHRVGYKDVTTRVPIPFTVLRLLDDELTKGQTKVVRPGATGLKERVVRIISEDGKVIAKSLLRETIVREPQPKLVAIGTKKIVRTLRTSRGDYRYTERRRMVATAYDPGPGSLGARSTGHTYLGLKARFGIVAVDPRVIPLRTRLYIPGYGEALAGDTGGSIKGNRIDLCFNTYEEAREFGRRGIEVYVLE